MSHVSPQPSDQIVFMWGYFRPQGSTSSQYYTAVYRIFREADGTYLLVESLHTESGSLLQYADGEPFIESESFHTLDQAIERMYIWSEGQGVQHLYSPDNESTGRYIQKNTGKRLL